MASDVISGRDVRGGHDVTRKLPAVVVSDVPVNTSKYSVKLWYLAGDDDTPPASNANLFGAELFRSTESFALTGSTTSYASSDDETDLEDVPDLVEAAGRAETDPTPAVGIWTYTRACEQLRVAPQAAICDGLQNEQLNLAGRNLGPRDLVPLADALKGNTMLSTLDLSGNGASGTAMLEIGNALRWNNTIRKLNLSDNNLGALGAAAVAEVMQYNTGITSLDLSHNNFNDEAAKFLGLGIEATDRLANLNLSHNKIGEAGGVHVGNGLKKSESIQILDMSWNKLRGQGIVMVIQALQVNMVTTHINLAHNGMGYEGSLALKHMLKKGTYLVDLDVTANRINWKCVQMVAEGIKANDYLEVLKIGKNPITTTGCMDIIDAVSSPNCCIRVLDLTDQPVTRDFLMIAQTIKQVRDFEYKHGGFVSCHDLIGRRTGFKVDPMNKMADFIRENKIRTTDLFKMMNKNSNINMSTDEFISGLISTGITVTDEEAESIMSRITPRIDNKEGIGYRTLLGTMKAQWEIERQEKLVEMQRKAFMKEYHDKILNPKLPPIPEKRTVNVIVHKFRTLLRNQAGPSFPHIEGESGRSTPPMASGFQEDDYDLFESTDMRKPPGAIGLREKAPGIMSLTRPIGAKTKQFGTDIKKRKKKKKKTTKSHIKAKKKTPKKKIASK